MRKGSGGTTGIQELSMRWTAAGLTDLEDIRDLVRRAATLLGAGADVTADLVLAVDELVTNIIVHGYRNVPGELEVAVRKEGQELVVALRDQAPPFDPTRVRPPDLRRRLEERRFGGLGVHLARCLTDRVSHRVMEDGGNELILVKKVADESKGRES